MIPIQSYRLKYDNGDTLSISVRLNYSKAVSYYKGQPWTTKDAVTGKKTTKRVVEVTEILN